MSFFKEETSSFRSLTKYDQFKFKEMNQNIQAYIKFNKLHNAPYESDSHVKFRELEKQVEPYLAEGCCIYNHDKIKLLSGLSISIWLHCFISDVVKDDFSNYWHHHN